VFGRFVSGHEWSLIVLCKFAVELTDARRGNSRGENRARVWIANVCACCVCGFHHWHNIHIHIDTKTKTKVLVCYVRNYERERGL
jgi:hypothetical protein